MRVFYLSLTDLQLSLDPSFASFPKGDLSLIVLGHDFNKLPGQNCVLEHRQGQETEALAYTSTTICSIQLPGLSPSRQRAKRRGTNVRFNGLTNAMATKTLSASWQTLTVTHTQLSAILETNTCPCCRGTTALWGGRRGGSWDSDLGFLDPEVHRGSADSVVSGQTLLHGCRGSFMLHYKNIQKFHIRMVPLTFQFGPDHIGIPFDFTGQGVQLLLCVFKKIHE